MTRIFLVRHAESEGNYYKRIQGTYDAPLTPLGKKQTELLTQRFKNQKLDAIYTSEVRRTYDTVSVIAADHSLPVNIAQELNEVNFGKWEGRSFGDAAFEDHELISSFSVTNIDWQVPGGETLQHASDRIHSFILNLSEKYKDKQILLASHGTIIQLLMYKIGVPIDNIFECKNTAVTILLIRNNRIELECYNDFGHLSETCLQIPQNEIELLRYRQWKPNIENEYYLECRKEGWMSSHGNYDFYNADIFLNEALRRSSQEPSSVLVVYRGNEAAGILELDYHCKYHEKSGLIAFCYLNPISRKRGLGAQLIGEAIFCFKKQGLESIYLRCAPENLTAYRFYLRNNFEKVGNAEDGLVPLWLMSRTI